MAGCVSAFIFDWDDTLCPTSALGALGPAPLAGVLAQVDALAAQLLSSALETPRSRVVLLTAADLEWVWLSAQDFLPRTAALLAEPPGNLVLLSSRRRDAAGRGAAAEEEAVARRKLE